MTIAWPFKNFYEHFSKLFSEYTQKIITTDDGKIKKKKSIYPTKKRTEYRTKRVILCLYYIFTTEISLDIPLTYNGNYESIK